MPARLLLVEDDPAIAKTVIYALEREGFAINHSVLLGDARALLRQTHFDALILDVGLPDGNGLELLRELRVEQQRHTPVLVLSAHGEEIDRVLGLELGADDYVAKPFSPRELSARVKALLRRAAAPVSAATASMPASSKANSGPFYDDANGQRLHFNGQPLPLTRREYRLLSTLLASAGRILSRDTLLTAAWGDDSESTDRTIDTHIKTLRAKLREIEPNVEYIATHRGMGYALELPAQRE